MQPAREKQDIVSAIERIVERIKQVLQMTMPLLTLGETKVSPAESLSKNWMRTR